MWWPTGPVPTATSPTAENDRRLLSVTEGGNQEMSPRRDDSPRNFLDHIEDHDRDKASEVQVAGGDPVSSYYPPVSSVGYPGSQISGFVHQHAEHVQQHNIGGRIPYSGMEHVHQLQQQKQEQQLGQTSAVMAFVGGAAAMTATTMDTTGPSTTTTASSVSQFAMPSTVSASYGRHFSHQQRQHSPGPSSSSPSIATSLFSSAQSSPGSPDPGVDSAMFPGKRRRIGASKESASLSPVVPLGEGGKVPPHVRPGRVERLTSGAATGTTAPILYPGDNNSYSRVIGAPRSASSGSSVGAAGASVGNDSLLPSVFELPGGLACGTGTSAGPGLGLGPGSAEGVSPWNTQTEAAPQHVNGLSAGNVGVGPEMEQSSSLALSRPRLPPVSRLLGNVRAQEVTGGYSGRGSPPPPSAISQEQPTSTLSPVGTVEGRHLQQEQPQQHQQQQQPRHQQQKGWEQEPEQEQEQEPEQEQEQEQQTWTNGIGLASPTSRPEPMPSQSIGHFASAPQHHQQRGHSSPAPRASHRALPATYDGHLTRGTMPIGTALRSPATEAPGLAATSAVEGDLGSKSTPQFGGSRKRPYSTPPAVQSSIAGGDDAGGVMESGGAAGGGGRFDFWPQAPGYPLAYRKLGGCHAEGCGEPATAAVPGASESSEDGRYCHRHAAVVPANTVLSSAPPASSSSPVLSGTVTSSALSPTASSLPAAPNVPTSIPYDEDALFTPSSPPPPPPQQQQQQQHEEDLRQGSEGHASSLSQTRPQSQSQSQSQSRLRSKSKSPSQQQRFLPPSGGVGSVSGEDLRLTSNAGNEGSPGAFSAGSAESGDSAGSDGAGDKNSTGPPASRRLASRRVMASSSGGLTDAGSHGYATGGRDTRSSPRKGRSGPVERRGNSARAGKNGGGGNTGVRGGGRCEAPGCSTQPRYADNGETRPRFCGVHKLPGQMNVVSRCCKHPDCTKVPHFGNDRQRPLYCGEHKLNGMVNVANRRCEHPDCQRQPTYGNKGDKRPRFCSTHKHPGMHDVIARRCEFEGCMTRAAFNFSGEKTVRFCASHKLEGMQNLKSKCCEVDGCKKYRVYGFHGEPAVCCASHKREGMVDVRSSRCENPECFRHPSFGFKWEKKRRFCGRHKLPNMIDVRSRNQPQKGAGAKEKVAVGFASCDETIGKPLVLSAREGHGVGNSMMLTAAAASGEAPGNASGAGAKRELSNPRGRAGLGAGVGTSAGSNARSHVDLNGRHRASAETGATLDSMGGANHMSVGPTMLGKVYGSREPKANGLLGGMEDLPAVRTAAHVPEAGGGVGAGSGRGGVGKKRIGVLGLGVNLGGGDPNMDGPPGASGRGGSRGGGRGLEMASSSPGAEEPLRRSQHHGRRWMMPHDVEHEGDGGVGNGRGGSRGGMVPRGPPAIRGRGSNGERKSAR